MTGASRIDRPGILYVIGTFSFGGTERHLLEVIRRLDTQRFRPAIVVLHRGGELEPSFEETGVPIHTLGIHRLVSGDTFSRFREASRFATQNGVRIVHGFTFHGNLYGALLATSKSGRALVTSERGVVENLHSYHYWARRFYHRRSRRMLVNSAKVRAYVEEVPAPSGNWLEVIPNGIDTNWFDPSAVAPADLRELGLLPGGPVVGHVGRFREEKGQVFLMEGLREVARLRPEARFLLVGAGPDIPMIRQAAAAPPLAGRVALAGYQRDVRPYLRAMDIFVLPSRAEGMPNALLEAMSMGVACVATRVGGTGELLDEGDAGRLLGYGDREALVAGVLDLLDRADERKRLAMGARARAVKRFSMAAMLGAYHRVYAEILEPSRPADAGALRGCPEGAPGI